MFELGIRRKGLVKLLTIVENWNGNSRVLRHDVAYSFCFTNTRDWKSNEL